MRTITHNRKLRIKRRVRSKIIGKSGLLRLSVFRSNKYIYGQVIDDVKAVTVASISDHKKDASKKDKKLVSAKETGMLLGKKLMELKIKQVVFDRGPYKYAGRVQAFCDGVREAGIII